MIYEHFDEKVYDKLLRLFQEKHTYRNEIYMKNANLGYSISDAERFVNRVFRRFIGMNICIIDKEITATVHRYKCLYNTQSVSETTTFINKIEPKSVYAVDREINFSYDDAWKECRKKFVTITDISAFNKMYGGAYIQMSVRDLITDRTTAYMLDYNFFRNAQYREVSDEEVMMLTNLLKDDREDENFEVVRYMDFEEMVEAKLCRKNCSAKKIPFDDPRARVRSIIKAKDYDEAYVKATKELGWKYPPIEIHRV